MRSLALIVACAVSAAVGMEAQTPKPRYDAATIKRCQPEENPTGARGTAGGTNATFSPGRFFVPCVTVEQLIYLAYAGPGAREGEQLVNDSLGGASNENKVRGGPAWVHSLREKYQIEATAAGATERTVLMGTMLRTLLEERFQLKTHRETEEVPMFALTVAKNGFKLKPMQAGDCDDNPSLAAGLELPAKPPCGSVMARVNGPNMLWIFGAGDIEMLAGRLSRPVGLHVIDQTGIKGPFNIRLEFHPDENTPGLPWPAERNSDTSAAMADNIFTALERQLGLKVERTRAPRGFIVIDHVERPGPDEPFSVGFDSATRYWYKMYHDKTY
jgi:uncharacterized protein (TIGR03435 family)